MENGATTSPLSVSDKAEGIPNLKSTESFPSSLMAHQYHQHRPEDDYDGRGGGGGGGGGGPNQNDSGANEVTRALIRNRSTTSDDDVVARSNTNVSGSGTSASTATQTVRTLLQPFDISITNAHKTAFKSPEGWGMAAALEFPFTAAQWKELERQAMIYKYMIASVPVPPHLLLPIPTRTLTTADATLPWNDNGSLVYNLRYTTSSTNKDLEPGRCKRTDGKKWRCSRDVAPHQKYCERHMHRGRPRSRKPVELHSSVDNTTTTATTNNNNNKKSRLHTTPTKPTPATANVEPNKYSSSPQYLRTGICGDHQPKETLFLDAPSSGQRNNFASPTYKEPNRVFGWSAEAEVVSGNAVEQQWLHLMDTKNGLCANDDSIVYDANACIIQQDYGEEPLNLFSYTSTDFAPGNIHNHSHDQYHLFQNNSDLNSSKQPQLDLLRNPTRGFIDAWSNGDLKTIQESSSVPSSKENLLPSDSLTLSMAHEEMGLATPESNQQHKAKHFPVSWLPLHSGGPLAEVLRPNNSVPIGSNPASPYTSNGDSISPAATSVSSPTGILHRALFSHSDSSVCNSPTLGASAAPPEVVAFQWLH